MSPEDLVNHEVEVTEFHSDKAKDIVMIARLKDGGLISYKKSGGTYVHTLNTNEGFERKLLQLQDAGSDSMPARLDEVTN